MHVFRVYKGSINWLAKALLHGALTVISLILQSHSLLILYVILHLEAWDLG